MERCANSSGVGGRSDAEPEWGYECLRCVWAGWNLLQGERGGGPSRSRHVFTSMPMATRTEIAPGQLA